ncbi:MAG: circularly permuted type 2 ATP-grasp protein [Acidimicrobiales bacterium]|nr:circularly permuted type 2 ATP-grasp protein [Acidimicrobiales bacterium]
MSVAAGPSLSVPYPSLAGTFDEMVAPDGSIRDHWATVTAALDAQSDLNPRAAEAARLLAEDGVTYHVTAGDRPGPRPWVTDPVPLMLSADEWAGLERGVIQRSLLLDRVLQDLYGERRLLSDGLLPPEVVYGHPGFLRTCDQIRLPGPHQLFLAAADLARGADGRHVVLSDRTQAPSGVGYALENRVVVSRVLPGLHRSAQVQRLAPFFRALRSALHQVAPPTDDTPRIVVLTPGQWSETAFEHGYLAAQLGVPLVQGADLRVRDGRVWMRAIGRLEPVHVIVRRVDAAFCDPVELRPDSNLGVPGLLEACRTGTVSVVNTLGSGVLENPGLLPFLPALAEALLDEPLVLPSAETWWCGDDAARSHVLAHLEELVVKPIGRDHGPTPSLGWHLSVTERADLARRVEAEPHAWVGQRPVDISTSPTVTDAGLAPRRTTLRTFAVARGDHYIVMPGGLSRVAPDAIGELITNQAGALSKDTCVLAAEPERLTGFWLQPASDDEDAEPAPRPPTSPRAAEHLFWMSRYAERAEVLARLLRVIADRRNEFAAGATPAGVTSVRILLRALTQVSGTWPGFVGDDAADRLAHPDAELRSVLVDEGRAGSLAFDVRHMLDATAEVRDLLSSDTWLVVGHLDRDLDDLRLRSASGPDPTALGRVLQALLALSGLAAENTVRDAGWRFLEAGRRIERSLQLTALLRATVTEATGTATDSLVLESTLIAAESIITYRRRYRSRAQVDTVLDLLVLDPDNPRSLAHQTAALHEATVGLPRRQGAGASPVETLTEAAADLVRVADTAALSELDDAGRRPSLIAFLERLDDLLVRSAEALDVEHFSHQMPQRTVFMPNDPGVR